MPQEFKGARDTDPPLRRSSDPGRAAMSAEPPTEGLRVPSDDAFNEYRSRRTEPGSSAGLIAGLALGAVAVAGIGLYMWSSGAFMVAAPGSPPELVKADPEPYKVKPENPGGMQVENQDKLVYDRVAKGEAPPRVENLLPGPEEPKAPPKPLAAPPSQPEEAPAAEVAKADAPLPEATKAPPEPAPAKAEPIQPEATPELEQGAPAKPNEAAKPEQDDLAAAVLAATGGREAATGPIVAKPAPPTPSTDLSMTKQPEAQAAAAAPSASGPAVLGAFQIQLASARSEEGAMGEWKRIIAKNSDVLGGLTPNVARVDLGEKGVFFRLRAGPLADRAAADKVCATLSAQNVGCIVVRP